MFPDTARFVKLPVPPVHDFTVALPYLSTLKGYARPSYTLYPPPLLATNPPALVDWNRSAETVGAYNELALRVPNVLMPAVLGAVQDMLSNVPVVLQFIEFAVTSPALVALKL